MDIEEAKRRARSGPLILLMRRGAALLITFVSTVTVARLVSPRDYGLANMSAVLLTFAGIFRDFGLTNALLRKGVISQAEISLIFWFNALTTAVLCLILAAAAPAASAFYREPIVLWIMLISVLGFGVSGLTSQHRALLNRDLRFSAVALIDTTASLIGFVVTLAIAWVRRDVWAIVYGNLAQSFSGAVMYVAATRWTPSRPRRHEEMWSLLRFGANSSIYSISVFLSNNSASILIGHFLGASPLGQYNRAQALYGLPSTNLIQPITQAMMPLLTRLRIHPDEYKAAYLSLVRKLCLCLMPLSATFAFAARPLVEALLGARWGQAGWALTALSPALAVVGFAYAAGDLFITQDRSRELRTLGLWELAARVGAIGFGVTQGVVATAIGFSASTILVAIVRVLVAGRQGPVSARDQFSAGVPGLPPMAGAIAGCCAASWMGAHLPSSGLAALLLGAGAAGALLGCATTARSRAGVVELADTFGLTRMARLFRRRP